MNSRYEYNPTMAAKRYFRIVKPQSIKISRATTAPVRSLTEASFGHFLNRMGQRERAFGEHRDWEGENLYLDLLDEFRDGQKDYKPDYTLYYGKDSDGNLVADLVDIKGKEFDADPRQQHLAHIIPPALIGTVQTDGDTSIFIRSWTLITAQTTRYYDSETTGENERGVPARVHKCPDCGRVEIHPEHRMTCTCCGHEFSEPDDNFGNREMLRQYTEVRTSTGSKAQEARAKFSEEAARRGLELFDADDYSANLIMRISTGDVNDPVELMPDFAYISQDHRNKPLKGADDERIGALRLQTAIFIFESLDCDLAKRYLDFLCRHGWDGETAYDAIVVVTADKRFIISERVQKREKKLAGHSSPKWRGARWQKCEACGSTYIASSEYPACPLCDGDGITEEAEQCFFV